jgi:hypothetical protein
LLACFPHWRLARRAARCIACYVNQSTSCPPCRWLHRLFLSLVDVLPDATLSTSLVLTLVRTPLSLFRCPALTGPRTPPRRATGRSGLGARGDGWIQLAPKIPDPTVPAHQVSIKRCPGRQYRVYRPAAWLPGIIKALAP